MSKSECEMAILAAYVLGTSSEADDNNQKNVRILSKHRVWRKDWLGLRETEEFCAKLLVEIRANEPDLYRNFVRVTAQQFDYLLSLVTPLIEKKDTNMRMCSPASERLILTLRFLATGDNFCSLLYLFRIPQTTISRIIPEVLDAIYKVLVEDFLKTPRSETEWDEVARQFNERWHFPNCIVAVDGKHVVMVAPPHVGSHSIILMGIADDDYKLTYTDVGRNGKFSDGGVFNRCNLSQAMETNQLCLPPPKPLPGRQIPVPYVLVMDDAFAMRPNVLKAYAYRGLTMVQRVFNYRLSWARRNVAFQLALYVVD